MEHPVRLNRILLILLMMTVCATQGTVVKKTYTALKQGHSVTGKLVETNSPHILNCSHRCKSDEWCVGCAPTSHNRYVTIHRRGTDQEKQTPVSDVSGTIYTFTRSPLGSWDGPPAVLYFGFDTLTGLALMAGNGTSNYDALVSGKIDKAVATDSSLNQWVDLGVLSEACITVPDTCGPEGAAVSVWVKIHSCDDGDGILSSLKYWSSKKTGFSILCHGASIRNYTAVKTWMFWANVAKFDDQWIHLVLNYIGPIFQEGVQAFSDGTLRSSNQGIGFGTQTPGDGRVVVGRRYVSRNDDYAQVEVDELVFFNRALLEEEVRELYNVYQ